MPEALSTYSTVRFLTWENGATGNGVSQKNYRRGGLFVTYRVCGGRGVLGSSAVFSGFLAGAAPAAPAWCERITDRATASSSGSSGSMSALQRRVVLRGT